MNTLQNIITQIIKITSNIENNYPELYAVLDENPLTMDSVEHPIMSIELMEDYLDTLKQILKNYIKTHNKA